MGRSAPLSVKEIADLTETLSTPSAVEYFCGLPPHERTDLSEVTYHFAGFAVGAVRSRVEWLMNNVAPEMNVPRAPGCTSRDVVATMRLLPNVGDQFSFFAAEALVPERDAYHDEMQARYRNLLQRGRVRQPHAHVDGRMLEKLATAHVLSAEVRQKLAIPGLLRFDEIRDLERSPDDARELANFLSQHDEKFGTRTRHRHRSAA